MLPIDSFTMRAPCVCGSVAGRVEERGGQDCVFCLGCARHQYNRPRHESGREVRSLASRPTIKPGMRARVFERFGFACVDCGRRPPEVRLELDHLIPRELAARYDLLDELIDSEWNLAPACAECNSGRRVIGHPQILLVYRCLQMAQRVAEDEAKRQAQAQAQAQGEPR